jgi:predicted MFS family arabinose efflux permease
LIGAGLADFALIGYHFQTRNVIAADVIPIYYAVAMASGAFAGLVFGKLFDRIGLSVVLVAFFVCSFFAPLVFLGKSWVPLLGMVLWGLGMGAQGSIISALIAGVVAAHKRSTAFGFFDTAFGVGWFAGSWLMGVLYTRSIWALILFSMAAQLLSLPIFLLGSKQRRGHG